ncbi:MAG: glycine--tRNA ligase subunit beta [Zetaproteobacteria bacterium]|nr:MAG: glycine--tRNA ligase subunit beta [Zetaproteobacteria bacterium]
MNPTPSSPHAPLLIEIGVEEIPAGVAQPMAEALARGIADVVRKAGMEPPELHATSTPRRLLVIARAFPRTQEARFELLWGPSEEVAFRDGAPTPAALGFARKAGVAPEELVLEEKSPGKGRYLQARRLVEGRESRDLLAEALPELLRRLPSPKKMVWQEGPARNDAFIRPVRWIVALLGTERIPFSFAGVESGRISHGHRVHGGSGAIDPSDPIGWLREQHVLADREERRTAIKSQLYAAADRWGVKLCNDFALLDEVTDLTEWPQVVAGSYGAEYLRLPPRVSTVVLRHHQRCFSTRRQDGGTSNIFLAVANIASTDPQVVARGNERVVNARLADAAFYFDRDPNISLEARVESLNHVVFQEGLGMVGDQVARLRGFILDCGARLGIDAGDGQRAAYLCKSDLTCGLVGEFPELQGYMGGVYARMEGESEAVAAGISEHYLPEGADDPLPRSAIARAIGIAERADKLLGYFHIGRIPTASADPFGLRRAAIGLVRLMNHSAVRMTLEEVLDEAIKQWNQQRVTIAISGETRAAVLAFIEERMEGMAEALQVTRPALAAALGARQRRPIHELIATARLLGGFLAGDEGAAVAAANKRIANILKKQKVDDDHVDPSHLVDDAELQLWQALQQAEAEMPEDAEGQLSVLAGLRRPVDDFFDRVMVMDEDRDLRRNRLALLLRLRRLFMRLGDLSCL